LFTTVPDLDIPDEVTSLDDLERASHAEHLWVAEVSSHGVVGFALAEVIDGNMHLVEMDVLPDYGRRGIGRTLISAVIDRANQEGCAAVTLTTDRFVPWNAPFYQRLGFEEIPRGTEGPELHEVIETEGQRGLRPERRVAMRLTLLSTLLGGFERRPLRSAARLPSGRQF
jgi:N-acetylglutamate synthase-like GNAT family acetyltransferase